jgi:hypothetical protein
MHMLMRFVKLQTESCNVSYVLQAFFEYFQSLPGQQRLIGYTVYGDTYYAAPGEGPLQLTASFDDAVLPCLAQ